MMIAGITESAPNTATRTRSAIGSGRLASSRSTSHIAMRAGIIPDSAT